MIPNFLRRAVFVVLVLAAIPISVRAQDAPEIDAGAYLAARHAAVSNDYDDAAKWFMQALVADRSNLGLVEGLTVSHIALGDFDAAGKAAQYMHENGATTLAANLALLVQMAQAQDYAALSKALPELKLNLLVDPVAAAWSAVGEGRMSDALAAFDALILVPDLRSFGLYHKALAMAYAGDFENAAAIFSGEAAGEIQLNRSGVIAYAQVLGQLERSQDAIALLDSAFGPDAHHVADLRAQLAANQDVPFTAIATAADGIADTFLTVAVALSEEQNNNIALLYARAAYALNPNNVEAALQAARILQSLEQNDIALTIYGSVAPENPMYIDAQIGRAEVLFALDRRDEGLATFAALADRFGDNLIVHSAHADALQRSELHGEAALSYDRALALIAQVQPHHWSIFYARGIAHERSGAWDKSEADLRNALELNPDMPFVLNYLGYSLIDRGENLDEALDMINRAVTLEPENGAILDSQAWAYFRLGRYKEALPQIEKASLAEPLDPVVTDHLGDIYWAVGRKIEARFQWRRALEYGPEEKDAARIARKLDIGLDAVLQEEGASPIAQP